jgi:tRNA(fMet)-specific endonuclease VapC
MKSRLLERSFQGNFSTPILLNQGTPISITDVFIAATGLRHKWTVVTNNTKDFRRIAGLALEDWR